MFSQACLVAATDSWQLVISRSVWNGQIGRDARNNFAESEDQYRNCTNDPPLRRSLVHATIDTFNTL